jgi:hypothetical protein
MALFNAEEGINSHVTIDGHFLGGLERVMVAPLMDEDQVVGQGGTWRFSSNIYVCAPVEKDPDVPCRTDHRTLGRIDAPLGANPMNFDISNCGNGW